MASDLPYDIDGIRYALCDASDAPQLAPLIARTFTRDEPLAIAGGLTEPEFETFVRMLSATCGTDRLTVVARDAGTGQLVGVMLNEDAGVPIPVDAERLSAKFRPIFALFDALAARAGGPAPVPGEVLHLYLLAVDRTFTRRGIARRLVEASMANGARRGYRSAITEATNQASQELFRTLGFRERATVRYADHRHEGNAVFTSIADHGGPIAMTASLGPSHR